MMKVDDDDGINSDINYVQICTDAYLAGFVALIAKYAAWFRYDLSIVCTNNLCDAFIDAARRLWRIQ